MARLSEGSEQVVGEVLLRVSACAADWLGFEGEPAHIRPSCILQRDYMYVFTHRGKEVLLIDALSRGRPRHVLARCPALRIREMDLFEPQSRP